MNTAINLLTTDWSFTVYQTNSDIGRISLGSLEGFLAQNDADLHASQQLRYQIFCEELGAKPSPEMKAQKRDFDEFDPYCDHLLVIDKANGGKVVGSYRILRRSKLPAGKKFYTENEFDLSKTLAGFKGEVMELGRSCVDINYRTRGTMQLLWRSIAVYLKKYNAELMFGCASFYGSDSSQHKIGLSYLHYNHRADEAIRPRVLPSAHGKEIIPAPQDSFIARDALAVMPPLIKGYLRLGGQIGDGVFEDVEYNTTDVCILLKADLITQKYLDRYSPTDSAE